MFPMYKSHQLPQIDTRKSPQVRGDLLGAFDAIRASDVSVKRYVWGQKPSRNLGLMEFLEDFTSRNLGFWWFLLIDSWFYWELLVIWSDLMGFMEFTHLGFTWIYMDLWIWDLWNFWGRFTWIYEPELWFDLDLLASFFDLVWYEWFAGIYGFWEDEHSRNVPRYVEVSHKLFHQGTDQFLIHSHMLVEASMWLKQLKQCHKPSSSHHHFYRHW